jgi:preprotein translocase subunit SecE
LALAHSRESSTETRVGRFFRDTYDELRKVVWPTPAELYRYTIVVVVTVVVLSSFIGLVDLAVGEIAKRYVYNGVPH